MAKPIHAATERAITETLPLGQQKSNSRTMRTLFFIINFTGAILFMMACVVAVGQAASPFSFLGGIMFFPPAATFAIAEWVAWYRRRYVLEKVLGGLCLGLCAFSAFGVVVNVGEALLSSWPSGFEWFVVIGLAIASYFGVCGVYRLWYRRAANKTDAGDGK